MKYFKYILPAFLLTVVSAVFATGCGSMSVDLDDYITIETEGYSGYGSASAEFDSERFAEDCADIEFTDYGAELYPDEDRPVDVFLTYVSDSGTFNCEQGTLTNGEKIIYKWNIDDEKKKEIKDVFGLNPKFGDITEEISGLEEAETRDIFEGISVDFEGISSGAVPILNAGSEEYTENFSVMPSSHLSNGDIVIVSLITDEADYVNKYGIIPETAFHEYTVENLREVAPPTEDSVMSIAEAFQAWIADSGWGNTRLDLTYEAACELAATLVPKSEGNEYFFDSSDYDMVGYYAYAYTDDTVNYYLKNLFGSDYDIADYNVMKDKDYGNSLSAYSAVSAICPDYQSGIGGVLTREADGTLFFDYLGWGDTFSDAKPYAVISIEYEDEENPVFNPVYKVVVRYEWYDYIWDDYDWLNLHMGDSVKEGYEDITYWLKEDSGSVYGWAVTAMQQGKYYEYSEYTDTMQQISDYYDSIKAANGWDSEIQVGY